MNKITCLLIVVALALDHVPLCLCFKHETETGVQKHILHEYDKDVTPSVGNEPLAVNLSLTLLSITNFDEVEEVLQTNGLFKIAWTDVRLAWNRSQFSNLSDTALKQEKLWVPDITIGNSVKEFKPLGDPYMFLEVDYTGRVYWEPVMTMDTMCTVYTRYFPFDAQTCSISVVPWLFPAERIVLLGNEFNVIPSHGNGHWTILSSDIEARLGLLFHVTLKRRTDYYVVTLLLPIFAVSLLTCFSFLVPRDSGEKTSYSVTVFLAYMVLMTFIKDNLPRTSTEQPILVLYIGVMLLFALLSVIWSIVTAFIAFKSSCGTSKCIRESSRVDLSGKLSDHREGDKQDFEMLQRLQQQWNAMYLSYKSLLDAPSNVTRKLSEKDVAAYTVEKVPQDHQNDGETKSKKFLCKRRFTRLCYKHSECFMFLCVLLATCILTLFTIFSLMYQN